MDEFDLIERYFRTGVRPRDDVLCGIGDDAAVVSMPQGQRLVIASDSLMAGTHFPDQTPAHALGYRCMAVNLSDLAAMAAQPLWATLALSMPAPDADWLEAFAEGFFESADGADVALVGGDTVRGPLSMTVTAHGCVEEGRHVTRTGAAVGDRIYVTGTVGDACAGLDILLQKRGKSGSNDKLLQRFLYPSPRVTPGRQLAGIASAMIDVSDGLHDDLGKLLRASGLGADLELAILPISEELLQFSGADAAVGMALSGGDDYELCFTISPDNESQLAQLAEHWDCAATCIGEVSSEMEARWWHNGELRTVASPAFSHF
jgi:thiamine-monophosphate kinase